MTDLLETARRWRAVYADDDVTAQSVDVERGRSLSYAEYGDPDGRPMLYFHGVPSDHREGRLFADAARRHGVRLLAFDRPGVGGSDPRPNRQLLDWPDDVRRAADALDLDEFGVLGYSGGGPYVAACAHELPERLAGAGIVSGVAPLAEPDALFEVNTVERTAIRACVRFPYASERAFGGVATEYRVLGDPWEFDLRGVPVHVDVWFGTRDRFLTAYHATVLAERLPDASLRPLPRAGHLGSIAGHSDEILATLVASSE